MPSEGMMFVGDEDNRMARIMWAERIPQLVFLDFPGGLFMISVRHMRHLAIIFASSLMVFAALNVALAQQKRPDLTASESKRGAADALLRGFETPCDSAKPRVWWHWMNGNITKDGITLDLEWMKRVGIGGFQNFDAALKKIASKVFCRSDHTKRLSYTRHGFSG